jgi:hypothetical protein
MTIDQLLEKWFAEFNPKQRKVVTARFGLKSGEKATLQEIGNELGVTRERVRQIGDYLLKKLSAPIQKEAETLLRSAESYLASLGGVVKDDEFLAEVADKFLNKESAKNLDRKLAFIFLAAGMPQYQKETDDYHAFWYTDEAAKRKFLDFSKKVHQHFKSSKKEKILSDKSYRKEFPDLESKRELNIAKFFGVNMFGDFGLSEWPEIRPKTIRDKAYLVLKKNAKPMHFEEIANAIGKLHPERKGAHIQTVHNELIKGAEKFVLVGRGIYGLSEQGYEPGTVREVITKLLKKKGPMGADEVVRLVNQQRFLKQNTIMLGLQNKNYFRKLNDGRYSVKEA